VSGVWGPLRVLALWQLSLNDIRAALSWGRLDANGVIAIYGAAVATAVAISSAVARYRDRPAIQVTGGLVRHTVDPSEAEGLRGTIHEVERGGVRLHEEVLVQLNVVNNGRRAVQITAVVVESAAKNHLNIHEIVPAPLPALVEPLTSIELTFQKEVIDAGDAIMFIGVVDALGRKHGLARDQAAPLIEQIWALPTRATWYYRRDAPVTEPPVLAFQMTDAARISRRQARGDTPLASRPPLEPPPRATGVSAS
jgi:hypothetical protein